MLRANLEEAEEQRYDPETLRKVVALAGKLQAQHQETLTADQIESVGRDVGLEPEFIRKALTQLTARQQTKTARSSSSRTEFYSVLFALSFPIVWACAAYILRNDSDLATIFALITPAPIAAILGFLSGKRKVGFLSGLILGLGLNPIWMSMYDNWWRDGPQGVLLPLVGGWIGWLGASLRERYFPFASQESVSTPEVLRLLANLQQPDQPMDRRASDA